jgi:hypothetical protein
MSKKYCNFQRLPARYSVTQLGGACPESDDSVALSAAATPGQSEDQFCALSQTNLASQLRLKFRIEAPCPALAGLKRDSPPSADSKCKEVIPFYCSSLANPAAPLKRDLRFATTSYGECARCSIFTISFHFIETLNKDGGGE